jgi:glycosyltransferase involved in cell wall biosynthesis
MRVLFLSVSGGLGGAERVLLEAVAALRQLHRDWALRVICLGDGPLAKDLAARGAEVRVLPLPDQFAALGESGRSAPSTVAALAQSAWGLRRYARVLAGDMAVWGPDVVHANGLKAHVLAAWAAPAGAAVVWHVHDYLGSRRVSSVLLRRHAHRAASVIANSHAVGADVRRVLGDRVRVEVVANGIDTSRFTPEGPGFDLDAAAGLPRPPHGAFRIGLVATYARWKGHETFLRALAQLGDPRARGYVVGGPVYETAGSQHSREELEQLAARLRLGDRVGFVPFQRDVAPVYRSLDVVVHASTLPEPFGLSVVEAMACGRAVVASDAGGVREIVDPGRTGLLHQPADVSGLASRLRELASDERLRARLGAAAASAVPARFGRDRFAAELAAAYERLRAASVAAALA